MSVEYPPNACRISDNYVRHFLCQPNICRMSVEYPPNVCRISDNCETLPMSTEYPVTVCRISAECLSNVYRMSVEYLTTM